MSRMKPQASGGKITRVKVGPKWTTVTIRISSRRLRKHTKKASKSKR